MLLTPRLVFRSIPRIADVRAPLAAAQRAQSSYPPILQPPPQQRLHPQQRRRYAAMAPPPSKKGGRPIVISGPSGSGKSTMVKRLLEKYPDRFALSVSHTTRSPRAGEEHGTHYHFVRPADFAALVADNAFIEHATFGANSYGTTFAAVATIQDAGKTCILDIEMEGVKQMHRSHLDARYLFIQPPSMEVLEQRLRGRGTDKEEAIGLRLEQAGKELEYAKVEGVHDRVVVNDELEKAWGEVEEFCLAE